MTIKKMNTKTVVAGLALGSLVTLSGCATNNPFSAEPMNAGYENSQKSHEASCGDKKAEGTCGDSKMAEGSCGDSKMAEGTCGDSKKVDGKCGEAKCGANK